MCEGSPLSTNPVQQHGIGNIRSASYLAAVSNFGTCTKGGQNEGLIVSKATLNHIFPSLTLNVCKVQCQPSAKLDGISTLSTQAKLLTLAKSVSVLLLIAV